VPPLLFSRRSYLPHWISQVERPPLQPSGQFSSLFRLCVLQSQKYNASGPALPHAVDFPGRLCIAETIGLM
jgi:hypothetical protein